MKPLDRSILEKALQAVSAVLAHDLIHLKLFAGVDQGPGRHWSDLKAVNPTKIEMLAAARWVLGQDAGDVFPGVVRDALKFHDYADIADQL